MHLRSDKNSGISDGPGSPELFVIAPRVVPPARSPAGQVSGTIELSHDQMNSGMLLASSRHGTQQSKDKSLLLPISIV